VGEITHEISLAKNLTSREKKYYYVMAFSNGAVAIPTPKVSRKKI
tara:strand:+ start:437 stop:571 length:135 start_codon:yes stop_codon:yes gene_type:complete